jgi:hypothetical protein
MRRVVVAVIIVRVIVMGIMRVGVIVPPMLRMSCSSETWHG